MMHTQTHPIMNIVVDVHDPRANGIEKVDAASRASFTEAIRQSVKTLRENGVPSLFLAGGEGSQLYPRLTAWSFSTPETRDHKQLESFRLLNVGPRIDEDIFVKRFPDGFTDIDDVRANPALAAYLAKDGEGGYGFMRAHYGRPTLSQYLHSMGVQQVTLMGAVANMCVLDTAIGGVQKGFKSLIFPDLVVGFTDGNYNKITWPKTSEHQNEVQNALEAVVKDPSSRGIKADALAAVKSVEICPFTDFITKTSIPAPRRSNRRPVHQAARARR